MIQLINIYIYSKLNVEAKRTERQAYIHLDNEG